MSCMMFVSTEWLWSSILMLFALHLSTAMRSASTHCISNCCTQISSCPDGTQAASLDILKAYRNSPIFPKHKCCLPIIWQDSVHVHHVAIDSLAMASGIQGSLDDACGLILKHQGIGPAVKWVDDFIFFRSPLSLQDTSFPYDLSDILCITTQHLLASYNLERSRLWQPIHICQLQMGHPTSLGICFWWKARPRITKTWLDSWPCEHNLLAAGHHLNSWFPAVLIIHL